MIERLGKHSVRLKELRRRVRKRRLGEAIVNGRRLVDDVVAWEICVLELYLTPQLAADELCAQWCTVAEHAWEVDESVLENLAPTKSSQGVLAVVKEPRWAPWSAHDGVTLYLERVQDPGNVGTQVRSAAALGATSVLLSPGCADPFHPSSVRSSAGAVFRLPIYRECELESAASCVHRCGGEVWATGCGGHELLSWQPRMPLLLMMGAEGTGLDDRAISVADGLISVPLERGIDSLNVATAAGILLFELSRQSR
ncbi:MAG: RNA methyltransferase [bacterium]|nr:RNA methyltransferase [bacterium]